MSLNPADRGMETTVDHSEIKRWVEHRGGVPARVAETGEHPGRLRIAFSSDSGPVEAGPSLDDEHIEEISWARFFDTFEEENLALRYRESDEGDAADRDYELVDRADADVNEEEAVDELLGEEVMSAAATRAANVDEGMDVVTSTGETVGVVSQAGGARIYVEPDPDLIDKIKIKLNWGDTTENEDVYPVPETRIERVEGDEVRIYHSE